MAKRRRRIRPTTELTRTRRTELLKRIRLLKLKERIRHTAKRAEEIAGLSAELDAISPFPPAQPMDAADVRIAAYARLCETSDDSELSSTFTD
jgi:hypothetical protein